MEKMKKLVLLAIIVLLGFLAGYLYAFASSSSELANAALGGQVCLEGTASVEAIISPGAGPQMLEAINSARETIDVEVFQFSWNELRQALASAAARGVRVRLLLDPKVDQNYATASFLKDSGVSVKWSTPKFVYTHAKIAIIDGKTVLVGSINWSYNAMHRNREAEVKVESREVAQKFARVFEEDWAEGTEAK